MKDQLELYYSSGLGQVTAPLDLSGMQLPFTLSSAMSLALYANNASIACYPMLTTAAANLLQKHATNEQIERYAVPMYSGQFFGTMNLSETQGIWSLFVDFLLLTKDECGY